MSVPTLHLTAKSGEYAKTVLMPGDPIRAKFIAENYFDNCVQVNEIRGMLGFTGFYKGKPISVQGSGMGMPSMGIYSYELFNFYEVENIIRIGSAGAICPKLRVGELVLGLGACTDSNYARSFKLAGTFAPIASYELVKAAQISADELGVSLTVGNILTTDVFYNDRKNVLSEWSKMGIIAVEMEAASLYINAARAKKRALCLCTISESVSETQPLAAEERQTSFTKMIEVALGML
ncbi:MAG: purine-nucleoside phosphorylase [Oscillospiraceae bacterium]|jgi:purine-nucleoside phosphorylase|nr:purine-nucleoside phosphorylase [Oscillospiraceae bacterium]